MPKGSVPCTKIDQLVDATFEHPRMSFLEDFKVIRLLWHLRIRKKPLLFCPKVIIITQ